MPGSPNCNNSHDPLAKCRLFTITSIQYTSAGGPCKLNATTNGEIMFNIQGKATPGSGEWCELMLMESTCSPGQHHIEFADDVPTPVFQPGYIRIYKSANSYSAITNPFKILVKKASGATKGLIPVTCKFRHSQFFDDACEWQNPVHTMSIIIELE